MMMLNTVAGAIWLELDLHYQKLVNIKLQLHEFNVGGHTSQKAL